MAQTHKKSETVQPVQPDQTPLQEEIQKLAYELYCQCGHEHGRELEHWVEAERRVLEGKEGRSKPCG